MSLPYFVLVADYIVNPRRVARIVCVRSPDGHATGSRVLLIASESAEDFVEGEPGVRLFNSFAGLSWSGPPAGGAPRGDCDTSPDVVESVDGRETTCLDSAGNEPSGTE